VEAGKRDPKGFFVILALPEAEGLVPPGCELERVGDVLIIKTKSRSLANRVIRTLKRKGLLREPE